MTGSSQVYSCPVQGTGITVNDLEKEKAFYESVLGMVMTRKYERNGAPYEYIMAFPVQPAYGAILAFYPPAQAAAATPAPAPARP